MVSSQIKQIQEALKNASGLDRTRFNFEGRDIVIDTRTGIFITMNPGYAGRTELPDNLKALFRPVTMVVPDKEQICENMLLSEGFNSAKALARKMTVLYKLAEEQLSKQVGIRLVTVAMVVAVTPCPPPSPRPLPLCCPLPSPRPLLWCSIDFALCCGLLSIAVHPVTLRLCHMSPLPHPSCHTPPAPLHSTRASSLSCVIAQYHYDWGLRALKSVLVMAGSLKRSAGGMSEELVLMRALRDMNLPKFVFDDVPLFLGLIGDLFPGMDCPRVRYESFNDAVEKDLEKNGYVVLTQPSGQVDKVVQLYETMLTRHTTMVVGQTGGGKTVIINTLKNAQTRLGMKTTLSVINPKVTDRVSAPHRVLLFFSFPSGFLFAVGVSIRRAEADSTPP